MIYQCASCGRRLDVRDQTVYHLFPLHLSIHDLQSPVDLYFCDECAHQMETVISEDN